jgi:hypothetical protein
MVRNGENAERRSSAPIHQLEARQLLSVAQPMWNISFNDPGSAQAAYYAGITKTIQAAGQEWGQLFDSATSIEITVKFDPTLSTAYGRSLTTSYLYHNADGLDIYEQGAASEVNTGLDPNGAAADVEIAIGIKPGANYLTDILWFDPDPASRAAVIPSGKVDAVSVMMQALGHAIAYNGWRDFSTGELPSTYASTFDQYVYKSGTDFLFGGAFAHDAYGADPALMAGSLYLWGTGLSHELMNGTSLSTQTRYEISKLDVAVMNDVGMKMRITPPTVLSSSFSFDTSQYVTIRFDESVRLSLDPSDFTLTRVGPGETSTIPTAAISVQYDRALNIATLTFPGLPDDVLPDGNYQLTLNTAGISDLAGNSMAGDISLSFFTLTGDANHDRTIGFADLVAVAQNYGKSGMTFAQGDFNYDGLVSFEDLVTVAQHYGVTLAEPAQAAPIVEASCEPAAVAAAEPASGPILAKETAPISKPSPIVPPTPNPTVAYLPVPLPPLPGPQKRTTFKDSLFSTTLVAKSAPIKAKPMAQRAPVRIRI